MSAPGATPPGWYPDPWNPGGGRWWDGTQWGPPAGPTGPMVDIDEERRRGATARTWLVVGIGAYVFQAVAQTLVLSQIGDVFRQASSSSGRRGTLTTTTTGGLEVVNLLSNLTGLVTLAVGVIFLVWFHRSLTNARLVGLQLPFSPGWGVGGFFIPIANFVLPYLAARELFSPGRPERGLVLRWWLCWIGAQLLVFGMVFSALFAPILGFAFGALVVALYVVAGLSAREMIERAADHHAELFAINGAPGLYGPFAVPMGFGSAAPTATGPGGWGPSAGGAAPTAPGTPGWSDGPAGAPSGDPTSGPFGPPPGVPSGGAPAGPPPDGPFRAPPPSIGGTPAPWARPEDTPTTDPWGNPR